jgi:hypothetical protein
MESTALFNTITGFAATGAVALTAGFAAGLTAGFTTGFVCEKETDTKLKKNTVKSNLLI